MSDLSADESGAGNSWNNSSPSDVGSTGSGSSSSSDSETVVGKDGATNSTGTRAERHARRPHLKDDSDSDADRDIVGKRKTRTLSDSGSEFEANQEEESESETADEYDNSISEDSDDSDYLEHRPRTRKPSTRKRQTGGTVRALNQDGSSSDADFASRISRKRKFGTTKKRLKYSSVSEGSSGNSGNSNDDVGDVTDDELVGQEVASSTEPDDSDCIEKVLKHKIGRPDEVGDRTTIYSEFQAEILKRGEVDPGRERTVSLFLIKWRGWSHLHNTWESEDSLQLRKAKGMKKLDNFMKRKQQYETYLRYASPEEVEFLEYQREASESLYEENHIIERVIDHKEGEEGAPPDYLCKWQGLPYSECTWEDSSLISRYFQDVIDMYLARQQATTIPNKNNRYLAHRPHFSLVKAQPLFIGSAQLELRDYQLDGLNWLLSSWCKNNSVILADEMGLGKTIQTISFISYLFHHYQVYGPFLLVVPLSTINSWIREFQAWDPAINVVMYLGDVSSRDVIRRTELYHSNSRLKFNVLLTTNEMVQKDHEFLGSISWAAVVVDEAHRLKNIDSQLYQILVLFKSNFRLLITGTPLQNSMKELWALLYFIMPHRFPSLEEFQTKYDLNDGGESFSSLHIELEPYILRRVKKEVEKSLPPKTEQILRVEMSQIQKIFYRWIVTKNYKELCKGIKGSYSGFLNIMVELKKCCNHASLVRPCESDHSQDQLQFLVRGSGKMILLDKLLTRLKEDGHRVLVFSQMTRMLDILAEYMQLKHFQFQRLDGATRSDLRRQAIDHFNADGSQDFCFLLSTRAGGLGLNLATADTVIIFDSDWNPQNDLQAQARAHRIGQKRQVKIYRFVTQGSIEEEIIERAKKKMVLDHLVIQSMDTSGRKVLKKSVTSANPFNKEEMAAIIKFGVEELFKDSDGVEQDKKLQELNIDDVLMLAEVHDTEDRETTPGEQFLSQFKVANFGQLDVFEDKVVTNGTSKDARKMEKSWAEIIPEEERLKIEYGEEEQTAAWDRLASNDRTRDLRREVGRSDSSILKRRRALASESSVVDPDRPRKRGRPRSTRREDVDGLTDIEVRRFIKSYKKFTKPWLRVDAIAKDANLRHKDPDLLERLANLIHAGCIEADRAYNNKLAHDHSFAGKTRGATIKVGNVSVNVASILSHEQLLGVLSSVIPDNPVERLKYRFLYTTRNPHWGIPWGIVDDSMLLVGVYVHGLGNWDALKNDPSLGLTNKILPKDGKPQDKHLNGRIDQLLRILQSAKPLLQKLSHSKPTLKLPAENKSTTTKGGRQRARPNYRDDSDSSDQDDGSPVNTKQKHRKHHDKRKTTTRTKKSHRDKQPDLESARDRTRGSTQATSPSSSLQTAILSESTHHQHRHHHRHQQQQQQPQQQQSLSSAMVKTLEIEPYFKFCVKQMKPVKKAFRLLNDSDRSNDSEEIRESLLAIGNHIEQLLSQDFDPDTDWRSVFWTFVSRFTVESAQALYAQYCSSAKTSVHKTEDRKRGYPKVPHSTVGPITASGQSATASLEHQAASKTRSGKVSGRATANANTRSPSTTISSSRSSTRRQLLVAEEDLLIGSPNTNQHHSASSSRSARH